MREPNDALPPAAGDATIAPIAEFEIEENAVNKPKWRLGLYPDHFLLHPPDNLPPYRVRRDEVLQKVDIIETPAVLAVKLRKRIIFRVGRPTLDAFLRWMRPLLPDLLKLRLKKRYAWTWPLAILFVLLSVPVPGSPERGIQPKPFDPFTMILGLFLGGLWVAARIRPHRVLFLWLGIWFLALSVGPIQRMLAGGSWAWLFFLLFLGWAAWSNYSQYRQFDPSRFAP